MPSADSITSLQHVESSADQSEDLSSEISCPDTSTMKHPDTDESKKRVNILENSLVNSNDADIPRDDISVVNTSICNGRTKTDCNTGIGNNSVKLGNGITNGENVNSDSNVTETPAVASLKSENCTVKDCEQELLGKVNSDQNNADKQRHKSNTSSHRVAGSNPADSRTESKSDWMLLCCALVYNIVVGLEATSFGILFFDIARKFDATQAAVGWCLGIEYFTSAMFSILASYPIKRYGCRLPGAVGSFLFAFGMCSGALAPNLLTLYLCYGILGGIGYSFSVISCAVVVQQRFSKHRALANSLASVGYSVGSITGPQITRLLLSKYGWSGALLLMGAIQAHRIPLALMFRSPTKKKEETKKKEPETKIYKKAEVVKKSTEVTAARNGFKTDPSTSSTKSAVPRKPPFNSSVSITGTADSNLNLDMISFHAPDVHHTHKTPHITGFLNYLRDALDFTVLMRPTFALLITAMCLLVFTFGYIAHLPGTGVKSGLTMAQSVWSLSTMSFTSLLAKLLISVITSCQCVSRVAIYTTNLMSGALAMFVVVFVPAPAGIFLSAVFFGCQLACSSSINHVLLVDLMGIDMLPRCLSLQFFLTGFFRLAGAPFVGWIYDMTGSYDWGFLTFAVVDLIGVSLMIALYCLVRKQNRQARLQEIENNETA